MRRRRIHSNITTSVVNYRDKNISCSCNGFESIFITAFLLPSLVISIALRSMRSNNSQPIHSYHQGRAGAFQGYFIEKYFQLVKKTGLQQNQYAPSTLYRV